MAGVAQWNRVAIGRLHPDTAIGSCTYVRGFGWSCFAARDARKLTDKSQVLPRRCKFGLRLPRAMALGMREVGMALAIVNAF